MRPLISPRGRRPAWVAIAVGALVAIVLGAVVWHGTTTAFDSWAAQRALDDFGPLGSVRRRSWLYPSDPTVSVLVPAAVAVWSGATRQFELLALAVVGPLLALGIDELIGKPLVHRSLVVSVVSGVYSGAYPSGHETGTVSWLILAVIVVFRQTVSTCSRVWSVSVAGVWALAAAVGLTVNFYHYATDTIGAIGLATAVMLGAALAIDRYAGTMSRPGRIGAGRP